MIDKVLMDVVEKHLAWEYYPEVPPQCFLTRMPFLLLPKGSRAFLIASESSVNIVTYGALRAIRIVQEVVSKVAMIDRDARGFTGL